MAPEVPEAEPEVEGTEAEPEPEEEAVPEVNPKAPSIPRQWKDPATSITNTDQKPGHVLIDSIAP